VSHDFFPILNAHLKLKCLIDLQLDLFPHYNTKASPRFVEAGLYQIRLRDSIQWYVLARNDLAGATTILSGPGVFVSRRTRTKGGNPHGLQPRWGSICHVPRCSPAGPYGFPLMVGPIHAS
jgi:hypothetical protein